MDNNEAKPVETNSENAGSQNEQDMNPEVDLLDEFQRLIEENKKLSISEANWKKVGLAKKRGEEVPESNLSEDEIERRAQERADEIFKAKQAEENAAKQREIALKALKENRELKIALKNRTGVVTTPSGAAQADDQKAKETFWTADQIAYFKKRGIDPDKVKQNYLKLKA